MRKREKSEKGEKRITDEWFGGLAFVKKCDIIVIK